MNTVSNKDIAARIKGLDGLRGLAALAVFGVHFNQIVDVDLLAGPFDLYLFFTNGEYGVALFFILSGLLLSQPFWRSILYQTEWPKLKAYAVHRLARLLPAYYFTLSLLIILTGYWQYPEAWVDILLHYSFLFNYTEFSVFSINAPFWTLAVEAQFYCLLPLLFLGLRKLSPPNIVGVLLLLGLAAYGLHYSLIYSINKTIPWAGSSALTWVRPYGAVLNHSLLAHLPHFIIGIICGGTLLYRTMKLRPSLNTTLWRYEVLFWVSLALILLLLSTPAGNWIQIPYGRYGLPIVPLLLGVLVVCTPLTRGARKILDSTPLRTLGTLSYGIYIYHLPLMRLVDRSMAESAMDAPEHWAIFGMTSLLLTLAAATLSYYLLEQPALKFARKKLQS